ncbi:heavy-metal-associated domain-containing protein [Rhizobium sp. CFBP 8762]|uniref:heavy-metal-associated domain-containing protein n=1 Tax=Rhizobium sp. CFBP 8762 TaxID=2775279 RepID=UPI0017875947|nr:heavy-metal-associated domain-containing protein [Rhizobium sp. CFBP 8762]MBD8554786.1 heavy-metal-associated domain-containing protein [Rhizobium sp. CFBP 8762]
MFTLTLPDMSCGHCVKTVEKTVKEADAQASVSIDLPSKTARIQTSLDEQTLRNALTDAGYAPA